MVNQRCILNETKNGKGFYDISTRLAPITYNNWSSSQIKDVSPTKQQQKQQQQQKTKKDEIIWLTSSHCISDFISSENGLCL